MHISRFSKGDIITRVERTSGRYPDGSYLGDRLVFIGFENNVAVVKHQRYGDMTFTTEFLEGWDFYPEELMKEAEKNEFRLTRFGRRKKDISICL